MQQHIEGKPNKKQRQGFANGKKEGVALSFYSTIHKGSVIFTTIFGEKTKDKVVCSDA